MEIKGEEKYLAELSMAFKNVKNLINELSDECGNNSFNKYLNIISDIREEVEDRLIDLS